MIPNCPRKGKTSHKCGGADHFGWQCKTKTVKPSEPRQEEKTKGKKMKKSVMWEVREMKLMNVP